MINDFLHIAIQKAVERDGSKSSFSEENLVSVIQSFTDKETPIDVKLIKVLLTGRPDVKYFGNGYYRFCDLD